MHKIIFIADFFEEHVPGGGELNNEQLINLLREKGYDVRKVQSHTVSPGLVREHRDEFFIISNFINLSFECRQMLTELNYIIYEHDHKYLKSRNPAVYKDFKAPSKGIINYFFYKEAMAVVCQSNFHRNIILKNLDLDNVVSVGGNLWSLASLKTIRGISKKEKKNGCSVLESSIPHKNTLATIKYCQTKKLNYDLVSDSNYIRFLEKLGANKKFLFFPKTPETLSRVVVEARMMNMSVLANNLVGACEEPWFGLKGEKLIDYMTSKREEIAKTFVDVIESKKKINKTEISIISTFHEGEEFLEDFLENITSQSIFDKCELILIDAASTGKEKDIVINYTKKHDNILYYRLEEKLPVTPCLNMAIKKSSGKYLTFGFIDDRKERTCLETLLREIKKEPDVDLVYGDVLQTSIPNEKFEDSSSTALFEHSTYPFSRENMVKCLPGPMPLWTRLIHDKCGLFDDKECNYADDWDMWLRAVTRGSKFKKVDKTIGLYYTGGRSFHNDNLEQKKEEAKIFFRYSYLFGTNFNKYMSYFQQFLEGEDS